jgi:hypothetical protein
LRKARRKMGPGVKGDGSGRVPPFIEVGGIRNKGSRGSVGGHVEARMEGGTPADDKQVARPDPGSGGRGRATATSCSQWPLGQGRKAADVWALQPQCLAVQTC